MKIHLLKIKPAPQFIRQNYPLWAGILTMVVISVSALAAPWIAKHDPNLQIAPALNRFLPPSADHWFGTDQFGRDVFARLLHGGRISLFIGLSVVFFSILFGAVYGAVSGFLGGFWDQILMRLVDMFLAFPVLFLAVTCMALFGASLVGLILVLTLTSWMDVARLVRSEVLSLKHSQFILKARSVGLSNTRIILRHLIPNAMAAVVTVAVVRVADIILVESALSFLGLGVQPPVASWGAIISDGRSVLSSAWWLTVFPGMAIASTTISFYLIGEGIQSLRK